jgi:Big-like domain-containing protein/K319-like protein/type IX secretion system substrate protein/PKD domain-containing protein
MKRVIVFCLLLLSITFIYGQFENTIITVSDAMVEEGDTFQIVLNTTEVLDEWDVIAFQFDLAFDESLIQYEGVALGEMPLPASLIANEFAPGILRVAYANYLNISGAGNLVTIEFSAIGEGETALDLYDFKYNSTFLDDNNLIDGNVTVVVPNPFSDVVITVDSPEVGLVEDFDLAVLTSDLTTVMGGISFQFELLYDTEMMIFTGSYSLGDVPNPGNLIANETEPGVIIVGYANVSPIVGEGSLCTLEFSPAGEEGEAVASVGYFRYNSFNLLNLEAGTITFLGGPQEVEINKDMVPGWNWFSLNVAGEDMNVNGVLTSIGGNALNIKSQTQSAIYYPSMNGWYGSLNIMNNHTFYKIEVDIATTLEYTGVPVDLAATTYDLTSGWNWISYAPQESELINYALGTVENGSNIKSQTQSSIYYPSMNGWYGSLGTLEPLGGYMLQMNAPEQLNYPEPPVMSAAKVVNNSVETLSQNRQTRDVPDWSINPPDYLYGGSIWGVVEFDGVEVSETTGILGCFVDGECRGIATFANGSVIDYTDPFGHIIFLPEVYSNITSGETLTFEYYDAGSDAIYDVAETIDFESNMVVGNGVVPFVFTVSTEEPPEQHFSTVWEGLPNTPYFPFVLTAFATLTGGANLDAGDEIALFDVDDSGTEVCVGVTIVEGASPYVIVASMDSDFNSAVLDGCIMNHPALYKVWDASAGMELTEVISTPIMGWNGNYAFNGTGAVVLEAGGGNMAPIADAGEDQTVIEGDLVQLDGSGSYDPDGAESRDIPDWSINPPDYLYSGSIWGIVELDGVEVSETTGILGCFVEGECRGIATSANGSVIDYTDPFGHIIFLPEVYSNVTSGETLTFKYYDAGSDAVYDVAETLDFESNMVEGNGVFPFVFTVSTIITSDLDFLWTAPDGVTLSDPTAIQPTFTAPDVTVTTPYIISLIVSDGESWSDSDEVIVFVENGNIAPIADAGEDQMVIEGDLVQLDGTGSYDPDGEEGRDLPDWPFDYHDYIYSCNIWGIVVVDGIQSEDLNDMIGVFVGDECRGIAQQSDGSVQYIADFDNTFFMPAAYSDETSGETLTFKLYDASADMIYDVEGELDFVSNEFVGNAMDPYIFTVTTIVIPDLDFVWTAPGGIELSDATSAIPTFVAPEVDAATPYVFSLIVSDGEAWSEADEVVIIVGNGNEAPVIELPEFFTFAEDGNLGVDFAAMGYISDPDMNDLILSVDGNDIIDVQIMGSAVIFTAPENWNGEETITFIVDDNEERLTASDDVLVIVTAVNDAPVFTYAEPEIIFAEDEDIMVDFSSFVSDVDGDDLEMYLDDEDNIISAIEGFEITFSADENWNGTDAIIIGVTDNQGRDVAEVNVDIVVGAVNDTPYIIAELEDQEFLEDFVNMVTINANLNDNFGDVDGDVLSYTAEYDDQEIWAGIVDDILFLAAVENWNGTAEVTIIASDDMDRDIVSDTFEVLVESVNDAPFVEILLLDLEYDEDFAEVSFDLDENFADVDGDVLSYEAEFNAEEIIVTISENMMYLASVENWNGTAEVTIIASDNMDRSIANDTFEVQVNAVNDVPYLIIELDDLEYDEDFAETSFDLDEYFADVDNVLTFSAEYNADEIIVTIADNMMYLGSVENWAGTAVVTITASDDMDRVIITDSFEVLVIGVNDVPYVYNIIDDMIMDEDFEAVTLILSDYFTDPDDDLYNYWAEWEEGTVNIEISDGELVISSVLNWNGELFVTVFVDDNMGEQASDTFSVMINPVNDAPEIELPDSFTFAEDGDLTVDFTDYISDIDEDILTLTVEGGVEVSAVIDGYSVTFTASENWNGEETLTFTVVDDMDRLAASDDILIIVTSVNDDPIAMAGEPYSGQADDSGFAEIMLDGSGSYDIDGEIVSWVWNWEGGSGEGETLSTLFAVGETTVYLTVTDNEGGIGEANTTVNVSGYDNIAPEAAADEFAVFEDEVLMNNVLANDFDPDQYPAPLTAELEQDVSNGVLELLADGSFSYTPAENWNGEDMFSYRAFDGAAYSLVTEVIIIVTPVNDNPVAMPGGPYSAQADDSGFAEIMLDGSGSYDIDGEIVSWVWNWEGGSGEGETLSTLFAVGETTVYLTVTDSEGGIGEANTTVNVSEYGNIAPIANADAIEGYEDGFLTFDILYNDEDPDNYPESLTVEILTEVSHGILIEESTGLYNYIPELNWNGADMFTYRAFDGAAYSLETEVTITIIPVNDAPEMLMALEDVYLEEDFDTYELSLVDYFNDIDTELLDYAIDNNAEEIGINVLGNGLYEIISISDWNGESYVGLFVTDGEYDIETSFMVYVEAVNDVPAIDLPPSYTYLEDETLPVDFTGLVSDIDEDELILTVTGNEFVSVEISGMMVTFGADANWNGEEVLTFTIDDEMGRAIAEDEVTIIVEAVNDAPELLMAPEDIYVAEDFAAYSLNLVGYFLDIDTQELTYTLEYNPEEIMIEELLNGEYNILSVLNWNGESYVGITVSDGEYDVMSSFMVYVDAVNDAPVLVMQPEDINLAEDFEPNQLDLTGYFEDIDTEELLYEYTFNPSEITIYPEDIDGIIEISSVENWNGESWVGVVVSDSEYTIETSFMVYVESVNDAPYIELPDEFSFAEDEGLNVDFSEYCGDIDEDELVLTMAGNENIIANIDGLVVDFSATANWNGEELLTITVYDISERAMAFDVVNVIVNSVNDEPIADANGPYYEQADEEGNAPVMLDGSGSYDIDGEIVAWDWSWEGGQASGVTPSVIFGTGVFDVMLTVSDNAGGIGTDLTTVTVSGYENIAPVAEADVYEGDEDTVLFGNVLYNDVDEDQYPEPLTADLVSDVSWGVLALNADGEFEYTPNTNWSGVDSFEYRAFDGIDYSEAVLVTLTVLSVNDPPYQVADLDDVYLVEDFEAYTVDLSSNFADVEEDELVYEYTFTPGEIVIVFDQSAMIEIQSVENWNGESWVGVTVSDNEYSIESSFMVYVEPINDEPVIELPESFTMDEGVEFVVDFTEYISDIDEDELELTVTGYENVDVMIDGFIVTFNSPLWYGEEAMTFTINDNMGRAIDTDDVIVIVRPAIFEAEITVGSTVVLEEQTFTISVSTTEIYDYWNIISFEFDLIYDAESYEYVGFETGEVPNPNAMLLVNNSAPGVVAVAYADAMPVAGAGELVTFEFLAVNAGVSEVTAVDFRYNSTEIMNVVPGEVEVINVNHPPVADAGEDQSIDELEVVMLDGTASADPDGQTLEYEWVVPLGIELDDPTSATPSFTAPEVIVDEDFTLTLIVSDGEFENSDDVVITVLNVNHAPVADAGEDQMLDEGLLVQLDGTGSYDLDEGTELVYNWIAPEGVFIDNPESPLATFIAPSVNEDTDFDITLEVSDGEDSDSDIVTITVLNAEIPEIEADIIVGSGSGEPGEPIIIDVSTSYVDPTWNVFSYEFWLAYNEMELSLDGWSLDNTIVNPDGELEVLFERGVVNIKFVSQVSSGGREYIPIEGEGSLINLEFSSLTGGQVQIDVYDFVYNQEEIEVELPGVINNSAPYVPIDIPEQVVFEDFDTFSIDLDSYIFDYDEGDVLIYTVESGEGILTESYDNMLEISSVENFNGTVSVTVTAWDGYSDISQVSTDFMVAITPVNDVPEIDLPELLTFAEDAELVVDFAPYINDIDGDVLSLSVEGTENIIVEFAGFEVTFGALENYNGTEILSFIVDDGMQRATASDDITIEVTSINDLPVAEAGAPINASAGPLGTAMVILDGSGSYDVDGEIVQYYWSYNGGEAYGETAEVELAAGNYTIALEVTDNENGIDNDNVQVSVAPYGGTNPIAYPDTYFVDEDMMLTVSAVEGILANDVDDGYPDALTALIIDEVTIGTLVFAEENWDGSFEYTPPANYNGVVSFTYVAFDGNIFSEVTEVTINVNSINDLPVAEAGGPYTADAEVSGMAMVTLTGSGSDIDGEIVLYEWYYEDQMIDAGDIIDYEFSAGAHVVTLIVTDNEAGFAEDTATVTVNAYENIAPVAVDDYYSIAEDETLVVEAPGVMANDYDPDVYPEVLTCILVDQRNLTLNEDGSLEYVPVPDFNGSVSFEYYITDGESMSEPAMIFIEVMPVNDTPVIELPAEFSFLEDEMLEVDFSEYISDIDSEFLTLTVTGNFMVAVDIDEFAVTFTAEEDWYGNEDLTFTISDNEVRLSATADVMISVLGVNDAPVINEYLPIAVDITIYDDATIEFYVNATDIDSDLSYSWTLDGVLMPIIGNIFTPEFTVEDDYVIVVDISDGEYTETLTWSVHYLLAPSWEIVTYDNFTNAHGYVTVDGLSADHGDMIGAFVDGECRGMGTVNGASRVNFPIYGDIVEIVNFKFWDLETDTEFDLEYFTQTYPGGNIGTVPDPLPLAVSTGVGPGWVPVVYTNSTIVYAIVTIEGEEAVEGDLVAAFVGDECRAVTEVQIMTREAIASMVIQGETVESVHFRIWDSSEDIIYNVATSIESNPGGVIGYPPNEILLNGSNTMDVTQTMSLNGGWNLVSLYVRPADMSIETIFAPIMENVLKIKDIYSSFDPSLPSVYNTLQSLEDGAGYYVKVMGVTELDITGAALDPTQTPIDLSAGWNLVAYVNETAMDVETAFAELIENETLLKVKDIFSSYDPSLPSAYNTLVNLEPGKGYYVRVSELATFYYPIATRTILASADELSESIWEPVIYTNSMIAYLQIEMTDSEGMILAAFAGEECRGVARILEYNGINISTMVVNSEYSEEISFKIYDPESRDVYECNEVIISEPGEDYTGMPVLTVTREDDVVMVNGITSIYPNPFNPETSISFHLETDEMVSVKVYNVRGQLIKTILDNELSAGDHILTWNGKNEHNTCCTSGVYFVSFRAGSMQEVQKVILMK